MDKDIKRQWIKALRSNKYQVGSGELCSTECGSEAFCCLGVLFDIARGYVAGEWIPSYEGFIATVGDDDSDWQLLPEKFSKYVGLDKVDQIKLAGLNDEAFAFAFKKGKKPSYRTVIKWIEENL